MYDVIVVGAGPAGIMCSIEAAKNYKKVLLIDGNDTIGKKLSITGGGRCNVTNNKNTKELIEYIYNGKFLYSALTNYSPFDIINYFSEKGLSLKEEKNGRMFPVSNKAVDVIKVLSKDLKDLGVDVKLSTSVTDIIVEDGVCNGVKIGDSEYRTYNTVIATGGKTYKHTGSKGLGFQFALKCGHSINELMPALTPLKTKTSAVKEMQGVSLSNVDVYNYNKKSAIINTDILIRHDGLTGPGILKISDQILKEDNKTVIIDTLPNISLDSLIIKIETLIDNNRRKSPSNALKELQVNRLVEDVLRRSKVSLDTKALELTPKEIAEIARNFKEYQFEVIGHYGLDKGFVTKGGIELKEINPKNFESKLIEGIYFIGEVLNIHAHTGGYNITACMAMGVKCGSSIY